MQVMNWIPGVPELSISLLVEQEGGDYWVFALWVKVYSHEAVLCVPSWAMAQA